MITDLKELFKLCDEEIQDRGYSNTYQKQVWVVWNALEQWMNENQFNHFNEEFAREFCEQTYGSYNLPKGTKKKVQVQIRAIRILVSFQKTGDFEFRTTRIKYSFDGLVGSLVAEYLKHCVDELMLSTKTIRNKEFYLYRFSSYLDNAKVEPDSISFQHIEDFFKNMNFTIPSRHNALSCIRGFLKFIYDNGSTKNDTSVYMPSSNYKMTRQLPTTYEEHEIKAMISVVERASAVGKRDYLILLLASEYGWRAKDITDFCFDHIDWDNNTIKFDQNKTGVPVVFPLLSSIGNAIIDYLKHARPATNANQIVVSLERTRMGHPLSPATIHSIVSKYLRTANVEGWSKKKHGPHALRHSLATNLLKKNVSMPIISTVLGHQSTETTKTYLSIDYQKLKQCALPMPEIRSPYYTEVS